jgi:nitrous oxidase accessory protein NosD
VPAGIYEEQLYITKLLTLRGPNHDKAGYDVTRVAEAIIQYPSGTYSNHYLANIYNGAVGVNIKGFTFNDNISGNLTYNGTWPPPTLVGGIISYESNTLVENNRFSGFNNVAVRYTQSNSSNTQTTTAKVNNNTRYNYFEGGAIYHTIYYQASAGEVAHNRLVNVAAGVQIQPYFTNAAGSVSNNEISMYGSGLYYNYANWTIDENALWNFTNNTVTAPSVAPVWNTLLWTGNPGSYQGIRIETYLQNVAGAPRIHEPKAIFSNNAINAENASSDNGWLAVQGMYFRNVKGDEATNIQNITFADNTFNNVEVGVQFDNATDLEYTLAVLYGNGNTYPAGMVVYEPYQIGYAPVTNITQSLGYETIQAAIDAANAGDEINIAAGYYEENIAAWVDLEITKSLTLKGAGSGQTIIGLREFVAPNTALNGVEISGTNLDIHLEGLTFTKRTGATNGPQRALRIGETSSTFNSLTMIDVEVTHAALHNVALDANGTITLFNMTDCKFTDAGSNGVYSFATIQGGAWLNNVFDMNGRNDEFGGGLHLAGPTSDLTITGGSMSNNAHVGFAGRRLTNVEFADVVANGNGPGNPGLMGYQGYGLAINEKSDKSENVTFTNITASNNGLDGIGFTAEPGKSIINISIVGGNVHNNGRIGIYHWPQGGTVSGISIDGTSLSGNRTIDLRNTQTFGYMQNITVKNTTIGGGTGNGVVVLWADGILYENNTVSGRTANGLAVVDGLNVVMTGNTSQNNTVTGAVIANVTGATFSGNIFANNPGSSPNFGNLTIRENSHNVVIEGNEIIGGAYGVWIHSSTSNVAANNNSITGSTTKGLANTSSNSYDATCNWWGTNDYNLILASVEGNVDVSTWLESDNLGGTCSGEAWLVYNQNTTTWYPTIQGAIDAASANDVIKVSPGTFNEKIVIDKPLTINGETGATMNGTGLGLVTGVKITSGDVTFNNMIVTNFGGNGIIVGYEASTPGNLQNVKITNCEVSDITPGSSHGFGIYIGYESEGFGNGKLTQHLDYSGLEITGNTVRNTANAALVLQSITGTESEPLLVSNNHLYNSNASGLWIDRAREILISENEINGNSNGVFVSSLAEWFVYNNTYGPKAIDFIANNIHTNSAYGIVFYAGWTATMQINQNRFANNGNKSINTWHYAVELDAICNWWDSENYNDVLSKVFWKNVNVTNYLIPDAGGQAYPWSDGSTYSCTGEEWFVYNVDQALFYPTIQAAIDAADVNQTIDVLADGNFEESFIVNKNGLTIQGPNKDIAGNDNGRLPEALIKGVARVEADGVTIKGLFIDGTDVDQTPSLMKRGILVANTGARANVTIENNIIKNWVTGISLAGGGSFPWVDGASISGNLLINNGIGSTENVKDLTIVNNAFDNAGIGLGGGAVMAVPITGNSFVNGALSTRYVSAASGVTEDFDAVLSSNTFDKAAFVSSATGQWYNRAIFVGIQPAINVAADGATVTVADGIYLENVNINKPNLTLQSLNGRSVTFIENPNVGSETAGIRVVADMGTVTVEGFTVRNFRNGIIQGMGVTGTAFIVKNNKVIPENENYMRNGIQVSGDGAEVIGNYIVGASLTPAWSGSAINAVDARDVLIEDNIVNTASADIGIAILNWSNVVVNDITIKNNKITGANSGIRIDGHYSPGGGWFEISDITITGNEIKDGDRGINAQWVKVSDISITQNVIDNNLRHGIRFSPTSAVVLSGVVINNNSIAGNQPGVGLADGSVDAKNNYWGGCPSFSGEVEVYPYYTGVSGVAGSLSFTGQVNNITATASSEIICQGQSVTLTAGNGSNFSWEGLGLGATKIVAPTQTTTYKVYGTDNNGCVLGFAEVTVTVVPAPEVVITQDGSTLTASGADTWLWSTGATTSSISVNPASTTVYTVTGTANGCSASAQYTFNVLTVTIGPNQAVCAGTEVTLTATVSGGEATSWLWSPGGEDTQSIEVSPTSTTQYTVMVNEGPSASVTIFVNPKPIANAGPDKILAGGQATLQGSASGGTAPYSYAWTGPDFSSNSQNPVVTAAGTYYLTVTDAFGCVSDGDDVLVEATTAGTYTVSGNVSYAYGVVNEQMHDVEVKLVGDNGTFIGYTAATGPGNYSIPNVAPGTYNVYLYSPKPWGGVTAADITAINNHIRNRPGWILNGIKLLAADVVDNSTSATILNDDRVLVNNRRLQPANSGLFASTGDWVFTKAEDIDNNTSPYVYSHAGTIPFSNIEITVTDADVEQNFVSLVYGDVNASYTGLKILEIEGPMVYDGTDGDWLELMNYPNPFAGQTTIRFYQPVDGKATLEVFDFTGSRVQLIEHASGLEGEHEFSFSAYDMAPGVYFITLTLQTSDDILRQTSKMIITR